MIFTDVSKDVRSDLKMSKQNFFNRVGQRVFIYISCQGIATLL